MRNPGLHAALALATLLLLPVRPAQADVTLDKPILTIDIGGAQQLHVKDPAEAHDLRWASSDSTVAQVYANAFVIALRPGTVNVTATRRGEPPALCAVTVAESRQPMVNPATLKQFPDERKFEINGRKCYGSELNGQRASDPEEKRNTEANRVINPSPLTPDKKLEWEVEDAAEVYDGAGVLMGTVAPTLSVAGQVVPVSKFNFGMSKVLDGKMCLYAFSVDIKPAPAIQQLAAGQLDKNGAVGTSAWLPLDRVVQKEMLLERIGVGKVKLPRLPLEARGFRITGGDPLRYMTEFGELRIVKDPDAAPVPSHYLRRPSGTVNIIYSVPGFGLGGQGLDSFLITDGITFRPAKGAKVFVQPTYYPAKHPKKGQVSNKTMTFIYGAAEVKNVEAVYGWVAKEALAAN